MDQNPYPSPNEHTAPPAGFLWPIAATFGVLFLLRSVALVAGIVPSGHVLLFSVAVGMLVLCSSLSVRAWLKGKPAFCWLAVQRKADPQTDEQAARLRFWLPFSIVSVTGVALSFYLAPFVQVLVEVLAGVYIPTTWIGITGSIIEVGIAYAAAWLIARHGDPAESLLHAGSSKSLGHGRMINALDSAKGIREMTLPVGNPSRRLRVLAADIPKVHALLEQRGQPPKMNPSLLR